jgi:general secretion pathway protein G
VAETKSATSKRTYFLRRLPRDPFADPLLPAGKTWGLRSYASPPDSPSPGQDVFDVYSLTEGEGMDGLPYRQW